MLAPTASQQILLLLHILTRLATKVLLRNDFKSLTSKFGALFLNVLHSVVTC